MGYSWSAAVIGVIIVVFSLNRIVNELKKGYKGVGGPLSEEDLDRILERINQFENNLDDINQAFYENFERLESRVVLLEQRLNDSKKKEKAYHYIAEEQRQNPSTIEAISEIYETIPESEQIDEDAVLAKEIRELLKSGKEIQQIAKELKRGVGEIELISRLKSKHDK